MDVIWIAVYVTLAFNVQSQQPVSTSFGLKLDPTNNKAPSEDPITMTLFWEQSRFQCIIYPLNNSLDFWYECNTLNTNKTSPCDGTDNPVEYGLQLDATTGDDAAGVDTVRIQNVYSNNITISIEADWFVWTTATTKPNITSDYRSVLWIDQEEVKHDRGGIYDKMLIVFNENYTFDSSILNVTGNTSISRLFWMSEFAECPTTNAPTSTPTNMPTTDTSMPTTNMPTTDMPTTDMPTTNMPTTNMPTIPTNMPTKKPTGGQGEQSDTKTLTTNNIELNSEDNGNGLVVIIVIIVIIILLLVIIVFVLCCYYKNKTGKQMDDRNKLQNTMEMQPPGTSAIVVSNDLTNNDSIENKEGDDDNELYQVQINGNITSNGETSGNDQDEGDMYMNVQETPLEHSDVFAKDDDKITRGHTETER